MADVYVRHDGSPLTGTFALPGGKHAFAHSLACAALADEVDLRNVPDLIDSRALMEALALVFDDVSYDLETARLRLAGPRRLDEVVLAPALTARSRNLFCLMPALLHRAGQVVIAAPPRGCSIGARPTQWYTQILGEFGVATDSEGTSIRLTWPERVAADISLPYRTMTGTVLAIAAAAVCEGTSTVQGASVEPSCAKQLQCLAAMGGDVVGALADVRITGRASYSRAQWTVTCDRIHAVTYLTAAMLSKGEVTVTAATPLEIPRYATFLRAAGAGVRDEGTALTATFPTERGHLSEVEVESGSEPLFSSDWAPFTALLLAARSQGRSVITDDVFTRRFQFVDLLRPFGLTNIELASTNRAGRDAGAAIVQGRPDLALRSGFVVHCPDIRGSASVVLAALLTDRGATLRDDFHLRRGYHDMAADLRRLGVCHAGVRVDRETLLT